MDDDKNIIIDDNLDFAQRRELANKEIAPILAKYRLAIKPILTNTESTIEARVAYIDLATPPKTEDLNLVG